MPKIYHIPYTSNQLVLFPQRIDENIAENDPVRMVCSIVDNLNLESFRKLYKERGRSTYHPRMMLKVILYAYMNNIYSCRRIEKLLLRDVHFIWLSGYQNPDFVTINRFRNRVKDEINNIFTQIVLILASNGFITLDVEYIDGTKIESKANKYTFVWRKSVEKHRAKLPQEAVADAGYGSEENYRFMDENGMEAFVKYNWFHKEQKPRFQANPFHPDHMFYNAEKDYYVCPMGQHMKRIGSRRGKTESGYVTESACYRAQRCEGCPLRCLCFKAKGNRIIEVNHRLNAYKKEAKQRLTSEEGIKHRGKRCIEPEAVFGQMKYNMQYKRFRHIYKDKVTMDFAFFAIAFNIKKMCAKLLKMGIKQAFSPQYEANNATIIQLGDVGRLFGENRLKLAA